MMYLSKGEFDIYDHVVDDIHFDIEAGQGYSWWHAMLASMLDPDCEKKQIITDWNFDAEYDEFIAPLVR